MNEKHVKGAVNETKGKVKENVGQVTGNESLQGEGLIDRMKGKVQTSFGDIKDRVKEGIDDVLKRDEKKSA